MTDTDRYPDIEAEIPDEPTDDMGEPALADLALKHANLMNRAADIQHLRERLPIVTDSAKPDSVTVSYNEETRLGRITLYYEYYREDDENE